MKKILCVITVIAALICMLAACKPTAAPGGTTDIAAPDGEKLSVVCTVFPQYDWVREIAGDKLDKISLTLLLDSGTDLHSYQPTAGDLMKISSADLFIYVGGESDKWVSGALAASNCSAKCLNLIEALGSAAKQESDEGIIEEHDHEDLEDHEEHDHGETEYDEHVWLSLKNAVVLCGAVTDELCALDAENADLYRANNTAYCEKLGALDKRFADFAASADCNTVVCADRFPFMYLCEDYGLKYFAAFSGCSAESEASFKTVVSLAEKVDEYRLGYIFQTENPLADIAKTVVEATEEKNQQILTLDSLQSVTAEKISGGKTYYAVMEQNINTLIEGLKG